MTYISRSCNVNREMILLDRQDSDKRLMNAPPKLKLNQ